VNSFFGNNLNRFAEGGWLGQKLSQFQTTLTKNMKSQAKRLLGILSCQMKIILKVKSEES
jgi:hypothetical protein